MIREFTLVALACAGICQGLIACTENFCKGVTCEPLNCSANQTVFPKGTLCGCCPACGTILSKSILRKNAPSEARVREAIVVIGDGSEPLSLTRRLSDSVQRSLKRVLLRFAEAGDECPTVKVVGGPPPLIVCGEGLECVEGTCKRPSKCAAKTTPEQTE